MASSSHDRQNDAALLAASRSGHRKPPRQKAPETYEEKLAQLQELREAAIHSSPEAEEKQHARGKYTARERVEKLLDEGSFQELDTFVRHRTYDFDMQKNRPWGDAVVTGHGTIDGRTVCVFSQDFTVFGGSLGEVMGEKMCKIMDLAAKIGCPVIGINDSGGARIQEGVVSLGSYGDVFLRNVRCSRRDPADQPDHGPVRRRRGVLAGDHRLHLHGQGDLAHVHHRPRRDQDGHRRGSRLRGARRGDVAQHEVRRRAVRLRGRGRVPGGLPLPAELPAAEQPADARPAWQPTDDPQRMDPELDHVVPDNPNKPYDMRDVVKLIVDDEEFFEVHEHYAKNIICGFSRLDGYAVGIVGNQPAQLAGVLDIDASAKAARFVRTCDAFNIPLITFCDVPGFLPGTAQEWGGIIRHGAKLLYAFAEATVPKITIITRKAYGGAYDVMSSKHLGADFNFAWPTSEVAVMGPEGAVNIIYRRDIAAQPDAGRAPPEADGRLQGALRQPLHGRRARLHRRRDRPPRDAPAADHGAAHAAHQARAGPEAQARQHPAVSDPPTIVPARSHRAQPHPRRPRRSWRRSSGSCARRRRRRAQSDERPTRGCARLSSKGSTREVQSSTISPTPWINT